MLIDMDNPDCYKYRIYGADGYIMNGVLTVDTYIKEYTLLEKIDVYGRHVTCHRAARIDVDPWKFKVTIYPITDPDAP